MANEPKKGTGKKPKGSSRRLYTDENPKDTVSVKFSSRQDIVDTLNKASFKSKPHARQSQIINLIHQRVRAAYGRAKDPAVKKRLKTALDYAEQRKEASKRKTQSMKKENLFPMKVPTKENIDPAAQKKHGGKSAPYGSAYELVKELVLQEIELVKELKCKYGTYFCNHDKVYKCRKGPKKSRSNEGVHDPMNPGILKKRLGNLSCSKVKAARGKLKDKGTTYAKALQRYLNYHCQ